MDEAIPIWSALGVIFVIFSIWLTVRIVNWRERWTKWTAVALAVLLVLYPLSIGPLVWATTHDLIPVETHNWIAGHFYVPVLLAMRDGPKFVREILKGYIKLWT
jgi:Kef-type K+ transport system membrane component KefB